MTRPTYVYVASSWRNIMHVGVCAALKSVGIAHYDFRNQPGGTGFSWKQVKPDDATESLPVCEHCGERIRYGTAAQLLGVPDDPNEHPAHREPRWRHVDTARLMCPNGGKDAAPKKGSDWESVDNYLAMVNHPVAIEGFEADYAAMEQADTFVLVLPCGKSAHLELGWAVGAGKRTAILLEDPVEPELMYRMVDYLAPTLFDLLGWLGVED